jgi:hypothetical protein
MARFRERILALQAPLDAFCTLSRALMAPLILCFALHAAALLRADLAPFRLRRGQAARDSVSGARPLGANEAAWCLAQLASCWHCPLVQLDQAGCHSGRP